MKVFVTGSDGYIGANLVTILLERGHSVTAMDTGFYNDGLLYPLDDQADVRKIEKDLRNLTESDVAGHDAVVHLAELSNDPLGQHNEENTIDINHGGSLRLATISKKQGIRRFVYTSSCSVYGVQDGEEMKTEQSKLFPQTAYAKCKVMVERDVMALADESFSPVFLRNATAYGPSPRMRFDIVLNNLAGHAWTTGKILMTSDGSPWRPMVHVLDICDAIVCSLEAPVGAVHGQIFNVGDTEENYRVKEIAEIVAEVFPNCNLRFGSSDGDNRSYRVSFDKIKKQLPGFSCRRDLRMGASDLRDVFDRIKMDSDTFTFRAFTRLKQLTYLIEKRKIDDRFYWT